MNEQFVTFEIALKLKELGFDEECLAYYWLMNKDVREFMYCGEPTRISKDKTHLALPLWQQAVDWLRTKFMITINIADNAFERKYAYAISYLFSNSTIDMSGPYLNLGNAGKYYDTYEKAREAAILKALELVK